MPKSARLRIFKPLFEGFLVQRYACSFDQAGLSSGHYGDEKGWQAARWGAPGTPFFGGSLSGSEKAFPLVLYYTIIPIARLFLRIQNFSLLVGYEQVLLNHTWAYPRLGAQRLRKQISNVSPFPCLTRFFRRAKTGRNAFFAISPTTSQF